MLHALIATLGIILTICFVVGTHEAGHFFMARMVGVKVITFSIGFGKAILRWKDKSGTEYVFALIPLGGYVRMADESEGEVAKEDLPRAYNRQPFWKKFLIIAAGPLTNFVSAFFLYWLIFTIGFVTIKPIVGEVTPKSIAAEGGMQTMQQITEVDGQHVDTWTNILFKLLRHTGDQDSTTLMVKKPNSQQSETLTLSLANWKMDDLNPDPFKSLGFQPYEPPMQLEIAFIEEHSAASTSRLAIGDKLIAVNQQPLKKWEQVVKLVHSSPDKTLMFTVERQNKRMEIPVLIGVQHHWFGQNTGSLGIAPKVDVPESILQKVHYTPFGAIAKAAQEVSDFTYFNLLLFGKMVSGKLSLDSLGGPITIFSTAGNSLNYGFIPFLGFLAFLSVSIGLINVFPIPGLDGGHLFLQTLEAISRRKIPENVVIFLYRMGFIFLFLVMIQAMVNDILRLVK